MSLMEGIRGRSISCYTKKRIKSSERVTDFQTIEKENPFKKMYQNIDVNNILDARKFKNDENQANRILKIQINLTHDDTNNDGEGEKTPNVFVKSEVDIIQNNLENINDSSSLTFLPTPRPYMNKETQNSVSLLSQTEAILQRMS